MKITFHNEKRKIKDLLPHAHNPRQMTAKQVEALRKSLQKFSLAEVPVINTDNTILAGHQRLKILQELEGSEFEIDVRVPNRALTQKEADEYLIRSNKNTGDWDFDELANNFEVEDLTAWGFDENFFASQEDIDKFFLNEEQESTKEPKTITCPKCGEKIEI